MPIDLFMPQLSPTMVEGVIVRWLKKPGDELVAGDVLAVVETDKASMEIESGHDGTLSAILAPEGATVPIGVPIAVIAEEGEEAPDDYLPDGAVSFINCEAAADGEQEAEETPELKLKPAGLFNADGEYDVAVIGAGPGGYVAAIRAAQLGLKVACIEAAQLGGICLNWGCIPTKALLRTAELVNVIRHQGDRLGLGVSNFEPDLDKAVARSRAISAKLNKGIAFLFKKNKVEHIEGHARFEAGERLMVDSAEGCRRITAKHVIVATGAKARAFPGMEIDNEAVITYRQALAPKSLPQEMIIIGSGAIGMEFACFYNAMGSRVTIIEAADQVLPLEDHEIARTVARSFKKNGIRIITGALVSAAGSDSGRALVQYKAGGKEQRIDGDVCLVAVGVTGNTDHIGIENTAMKVAGNRIEVDDWYRTDQPGVYAIGDVIGAPALAHVASHEGVICAEAIAGGRPHRLDYDNVPGCTYCQPQIGSCGKTEQQCREEGIDITIGRMPYQSNGKALGLGETEGLVKTIFDAGTGKLLGAHIVGAEATEMIVPLGLARTLGATHADLARHMFPHPTLSEMIHESALDSDGRAIHS